MGKTALCKIPPKGFNTMCKLMEGCIKTKTQRYLNRTDYIMLIGEDAKKPVTAYACSGVALARYVIPRSWTERPFCCYIQVPRVRPTMKDGWVHVFNEDGRIGISFQAMSKSPARDPSSVITQVFDDPSTVENVRDMRDLKALYEKMLESVKSEQELKTTALNASYLQAVPVIDSYDRRVFITQGSPLTPVRFQQDDSEFFIMPIRTTHPE